METSDSEYFESADEDFCSDDEVHTKKNQNIKGNTPVKLKEKLKDISINDNLVHKSIEKENLTKKDDIDDDYKSNEVSKKTAVQPGYSESNVCHDSTDDNKNLQDPQNTELNQPIRSETCSLPRNNQNKQNDIEMQSDINNSKPKIQVPPAVSTSGFASEMVTDTLPTSSFQSNLENVTKSPTKPEFGIPPAVATCWEPGVTNITQPFQAHPAYEKLMENKKNSTAEVADSDVTNANKGPGRPEFGIPPARTTCWVPRVTRTDVTSASKPQRPEFGIPPAIPTCWIPGVTKTDNVNTSFEPHPAYIRLMEQRKQNSEVPSEEPHKLAKDVNTDQQAISSKSVGYAEENMSHGKPQRPEFGIPPAIPTCWIPGVTKTDNVNTSFEPHPAYIKLMEQKKQNSEVPSEESHKLAKDVNTDQPSISSKSVGNVEENMWDDDGDWDDFDIPPKQIEEMVESKTERPSLDQKESKKIEENMWEDDDWEPVDSNVQQQDSDKRRGNLEANQEKSTWGGWSSWGLSSVISTATTLTSQVSQGITNVLETGIGAPDPAELARINKLEKEKIREAVLNKEQPPEKPVLGFGLGNLVQGVTKLVETTGTKVISGGLDTLETIGKKTMEVLQENDPGLKKKRAFLKLEDDKPILSQILREAKEKAEQENKELEKKHFARKANYETLFDDHQGLVHLEALEMLSKQCDIKLQSLLESTSNDVLNDIQETLDQVKELCELPEEDDEETLSMNEIKERLESAVSEINVKITYSRLLTTWEEVETWLTNLNLKICNKNELHQQAIESLAQLTAIAVEQFHKAGELLLIKDHRSTADEADSLVQLTTTLTSLIGIVAARFSEKLNMAVVEDADKEEVNSLITNVFFEAANSSSYIQDAFQLLIPVLQVGAV